VPVGPAMVAAVMPIVVRLDMLSAPGLAAAPVVALAATPLPVPAITARCGGVEVGHGQADPDLDLGLGWRGRQARDGEGGEQDRRD